MSQQIPNRREQKQKKYAEFKRRNRRSVFMGVFFCLCLIGLAARIGYIKYKYGNEYEIIAVMQLITGKNSVEKVSNPNRGYILDRNKQPLAVSSRVYTVYMDVKVLDSRKPTAKKNYKKNTLEAINEVLGIPMSTLESYFAKDAEGNLLDPTNYCVLARKVPAKIANLLKEKDVKDVYLEDDTQRMYVDPTLAPQTIGFIRGDAMWGLESQYNTYMVGEQGRMFRTYDQDNMPVTEDIPAIDGYSLITTLDSGIQRIAQSVVEKAAADIQCQYTGMLVMNPYTGEILAMAQWPSFSLSEPDNPEYFTDRQISNWWEALSAEEQLNQMYKVWGNYHTTKSFEPGSIFKPVVVAAALEENIIDRSNDTFFCGGEVQVYDRNIPCWSKYGHGGQNVVEVLANSCNVSMISIIQRLGKDLFYKYRCDFGFGEWTGIDLPGEAPVSSPSVMYPLSQLNPVELATSSMGQGFNNTAIQAITAFSAVINGGNLMQPYLVSQIVDDRGTVVKDYSPTVVRKVISGATSDYMREALRMVVEQGGTGYGAHIDGYSIGGKTGSGQQGKDRDEMTLTFMAFLPVENPQYIALAIIDRPADNKLLSGTTVSPMIKSAFQQIIEYKNIRPVDEAAEIEALRNSGNDKDILSDFSGQSLVDATHNLNNLDIDYQVVGGGTVVSYHFPAAGQPVPKTSPVFLYMDAESQIENEMTYVPDVEGLSMEQAENYIRDAQLMPITFMDKTGVAGADGDPGEPVTYNMDYWDNREPGKTVETVNFVIYKQYPSPGAYVQKGTEIKLKAGLKE